MGYAVGLSGNIASGKTSAAEFFTDFGIEVINADKVSKELTVQHTVAYQKVADHFGSEIILPNGSLDRKQLRAIIFNLPRERVWLEELLHPLIRQELKERVLLSRTPYCVIEIPLLFDKKDYPYLNKVLVISAPQPLQISRIMNRDHCTREQAQAILSAQADPDQYINNADDVIVNDSGLGELKQALELVHHKYLKEFSRIGSQV